MSRYIPFITAVVVIEVLLLLVVPLAYYECFAPKPEIKLFETYPLTDAQIRESWPNLPTAQEIVKSGVYGGVDTSHSVLLPNSTAHAFYYQSIPNWWDNSTSGTGIIVVENRTETNIPNMLRGGLVPVVYHIYLSWNNGSWISVPQTYLTNSTNPPTIPSDVNNGLLGTSLPINYGLAAITAISITVVIAICYTIFARAKQQRNSNQPSSIN